MSLPGESANRKRAGRGTEPAAAIDYARRNRTEFLSQLSEFVRFPTIRAQPNRAADLRNCAAWLARNLRIIGLNEVSIVSTPGHPLVYAEWSGAPNRPTVIIYGHYDVQPVDPLSAWKSPPFEPTVRGGNLYGRGASDDKGQMFAHVKALEAYLQTSGGLPVNVKVI